MGHRLHWQSSLPGHGSFHKSTRPVQVRQTLTNTRKQFSFSVRFKTKISMLPRRNLKGKQDTQTRGLYYLQFMYNKQSNSSRISWWLTCRQSDFYCFNKLRITFMVHKISFGLRESDEKAASPQVLKIYVSVRRYHSLKCCTSRIYKIFQVIFCNAL